MQTALRVNLEALLETHEVLQIVALDMFPYTSHLEALAYLRKRGGPGAEGGGLPAGKRQKRSA